MPAAEEKLAADACWSCGRRLILRSFSAHIAERCFPHPLRQTTFRSSRFLVDLTIETSALERAFYRFSRKLHPDMYARASDEEQEWSLRNASLLNDAYRTLKDPISRTEYLFGWRALRSSKKASRGQIV